jgi:hypothetical protein
MAFSNSLWELLFSTQLDPQEEQKYQQWVKEQSAVKGRDISRDNYDYDLRGLFRESGGFGDNGHATDKFKKPNHPTFSTQSQYSTSTMPGGLWESVGGQWQYTPSDMVRKMQGEDFLRWYFDNYEKGSKLRMP